jgi:hypothetical protein
MATFEDALSCDLGQQQHVRRFGGLAPRPS